MSTRNGVRADQVMTNEKTGGNKSSRSPYFQVIIKVITMILMMIITIAVIITCRDRYSSPTTTNTALLVTLYNIQKPL